MGKGRIYGNVMTRVFSLRMTERQFQKIMARGNKTEAAAWLRDLIDSAPEISSREESISQPQGGDK